MAIISQYAVQNYIITPAATAVGSASPRDISNQKWHLTMSGIAISDLKCNKSNDWMGETLQLGPDIRTPMQYAINNFNIPIPADSPYVVNGWDGPRIIPLFQVEQYTIHAALASVFDEDTAVNAGFSINDWRPSPFKSYSDSRPGGTSPVVNRMYDGVLVDVAVRDIDAWLYRISYQITLLGKIIFFRTQGM